MNDSLNYPYKMVLSDKAIGAAIASVDAVYDPLPQTTCDHRALCCKAGCPNMYFAEFLSIRRKYVDKMDKLSRMELTLNCIRQYLQPQDVAKPKPCVFLGDKNMCGVYEARPLKCRLYGLWPKDAYDQRVDAVAKDMSVPKESISLCMQCDRVKIKPEYKDKFPNGVVPIEMIKNMEMFLRANDLQLGVPQKIQDEGYGYLTYHDWHIMFELGETYMSDLTMIRSKFNDAEKEQLIVMLKENLLKRGL